MNRRTWLYAAPLLLLGLSSCALFQRQIHPRWMEDTVECNSESVLYDVILFSLENASYPVGSGADSGARQIVSGWFRSGAQVKGKGYRQRATIEYIPVPGATRRGEFSVRVRVQREINESFRPLDPRYADWQESQDNPEEGERVLQYIRSFLAQGNIEVGPKGAKRFQ
jgi:hypothetical protein